MASRTPDRMEPRADSSRLLRGAEATISSQSWRVLNRMIRNSSTCSAPEWIDAVLPAASAAGSAGLRVARGVDGIAFMLPHHEHSNDEPYGLCGTARWP